MNEPADRVRIEWRTVLPEEIGTVHALHLAALAGMEPGLVRPDTREHFEAHAGKLGTILGGFAEEAGLVAYGVLGIASDTASHLARLLGVDDAGKSRFGILDGAASRPDWRGQRLHRELIRARLDHATQAGRTLIGATVAPGNIASLRGLLHMHFRVVGFAMLYGGLPRLLVMRDMVAPVPGWKLAHKVVTTDVRGHELALAEGLKGFDCSEDSTGAWLVHYGYTADC